MKYHDQINHPNWQRKRLDVMKEHDFACQECGDRDTQLNVHHPFYKTGAMIWDYATGELMCLCSVCHKKYHDLQDKIKRHLAVVDLKGHKDVLDFLKKMIKGAGDKQKKPPECKIEPDSSEIASLSDMLEKLMGGTDG